MADSTTDGTFRRKTVSSELAGDSMKDSTKYAVIGIIVLIIFAIVLTVIWYYGSGVFPGTVIGLDSGLGTYAFWIFSLCFLFMGVSAGCSAAIKCQDYGACAKVLGLYLGTGVLSLLTFKKLIDDIPAWDRELIKTAGGVAVLVQYYKDYDSSAVVAAVNEITPTFDWGIGTNATVTQDNVVTTYLDSSASFGVNMFSVFSLATSFGTLGYASMLAMETPKDKLGSSALKYATLISALLSAGFGAYFAYYWFM